MKWTFQQQLLASAITAAMANITYSTDRDLNLTGGTWAGSGVQAANNDVANAAAHDNVTFSGNNRLLTVTNNGTANDGSGFNTFYIGTITSTADNSGVSIEIGSANLLAVTINSVSDIKDFTIERGTFDDTVTVDIVNNLDLNGSLMMGNDTGVGTTGRVDLTLNGDTQVSGNIIVKGDTDSMVEFEGDVETTGIYLGGSNNAGIYTASFDASGGKIIVESAINKDNTGTAEVTVSGGEVTQVYRWGANRALDRIEIEDNGELILLESVHATNIKIGNNQNGNASATFLDDVTATSISLGVFNAANNSTATFDSSANGTLIVTGALNKVHNGTAAVIIDGRGNNDRKVIASSAWGAITALDTVTLQNGGNLVLGNTLAATNVAIGAGSKLTTAANKAVTAAIAFNGNGILSVEAAGNITGDVTTGKASEGTLEFAGAGEVTGHVGAGNALGTISLLGSNQTVNITNDLSAAQANNIGNNKLTVGGTFTAAANQELKLTVTGDPATSGKITSTGLATIDANTKLFLTADIGDSIAFESDGSFSPITLVQGGTGGTVAQLANLIGDSSLRLQFVQRADTDSLIVDVNQIATNTSLLTGDFSSIGSILDNLQKFPNLNEDLDEVVGKSLTVSTVEQLRTLVDSLKPATSVAPVVADVFGTVQSQAVRRMAFLRDNNKSGGINMGDPLDGAHIWGKVFDNKIDQDSRDGVEGYDADTTGVMLGIDTGDYWDDKMVGFAISNANTKVDYEKRNTSKSDISSVQLTAYGDYHLSDTAFLTAMVGYAHNSIETTRRNVGGVAGRTAEGSTDGHQYSASLEAGNDFQLNTAGGVTVTPSILLSYSHISQDKYTETGAGGTSLTVDVDNNEILDLGLNVEMAWQYELNEGNTLEPTIRLGYSYDLIADRVESTSRFTGGGASFKTEGLKPERSTYNAGVGLALFSGNDWELSGSYDFEYKDGYKAHSGSVKATYKF